MKKIILVSALILLILPLATAAGASFDDAEEITAGQTISGSIIVESDIHYYKYHAYTGDNVKITINLKPTTADFVWMDFETYNNEFQVTKSIRLTDEKGEREIDEFLATWDGMRYIKISKYENDFYKSFDYEFKLEITCKEGYSNPYRKCVNGEWEETRVEDVETGRKIFASECNGCVYNEKCYPIGARFTGNNQTNKYCNYELEVIDQKEETKSCQENYECKSNECKNQECIRTSNFLQRIWNWLKKLFGGK